MLVTFVALTATTLLAGPIRLGSIANARFGDNWTLDGPEVSNTRAKLLNIDNFGPAGVVQRAIEITDTGVAVGSVDEALLNQFDVFFVGYFGDNDGNAFTAAELDAMRAWVWNGGSLIVTCDDESVDATCSAFGHPSGGAGPITAVPADGALNHPLVQGAFGSVTSTSVSGDYSTFTATTGSQVVLRDSAGAGAVAIVRQWGSGQVILFSDVDMIANAATGGDTIVSDNDRFLGNLFAYAAMPYDLQIDAAAHTGGASGSVWRSDVDLLNLAPAADTSVSIALLRANQANLNPGTASVVVPAGTTRRIDDVLAGLFNAGNAGLGLQFKGGELFANSRFYNVGAAAGKIYGMHIPAMAPAEAVTSCRPGVFHHLSYSPNASVGQRTNIGATNASAIATTWVIKLYGDDGGLLATHTSTLAAYEHRQFTNIHKLLGTPAVSSGWASVEVTTPGGIIHPYAMRIENVGGDPIYMPAELLDVTTSSRVDDAFAGEWLGGWGNTTFASSGDALLRLDFDLPNQAVEATLDLDGSFFGGSDPPPQTLVGMITDTGIVFAGVSPALGTYDITVDGFCSVSGNLTALPTPTIDSVELEGTATPEGIALSYTVHFSALGGGGTANGTLTLER